MIEFTSTDGQGNTHDFKVIVRDDVELDSAGNYGLQLGIELANGQRHFLPPITGSQMRLLAEFTNATLDDY